jgi:cytochrome c553
MDGRGVAPGIPHLAAQRERYLLLALTEYKEVKRTHAALRDLAGRLTATELRNVVAYYASQPPVPPASMTSAQQASLLEKGKALAAACAKCHGEDGNSKTPGTPSLAGQQPHYLVTAIQEYHRGDRGTAAMKAILRDASRLELESLALYYASRTPAQRPAPSVGDPAAGEPRTAMCGAWSYAPQFGKITVVVDDDIDIRDINAVLWAVSFRVQPERDVVIMPGMAAVQLDPSQAPAEAPQEDISRRVSSKLGIDATRKHAFPEIAAPPKEHLESVRKNWQSYGF